MLKKDGARAASRRYVNVELPDGTVKRISKKAAINQQAGGRLTSDIDKDFMDGPRMKVSMSGKVDNDGDWLEFLGVEPENLLNKCVDKSPATKEYVRVWGSRILKNNKPAPTGDALRFTRNIRNEDTRAAYEEYFNKDVKRATFEAYNNCMLTHREASLPALHKQFCQDRMCNPYTVTTGEELEAIRELGILSEAQNRQMTSCYNSGYVCESTGLEVVFPRKNFTHLDNTGAGDCLFIAFAHYMHIVESLGGVFPVPAADNTGLPKPDVIPIGEQTVRGLSKQAAAYRKEVVAWLRENLDEVVGVLPLRQDIAILATETISSVVPLATKRKVLSDFINTYPNEAAILGLDSKDIAYVTRLCYNSEDLITDNPVIEEPLNMLMNAYVNSYLDSMSRTSTYGGQLEISALSRIYNVNILILQRTEDRNVLGQNFGSHVVRPRGTVYLYHLQKIGSSGKLHYETMFPIPNLSKDSKVPAVSLVKVKRVHQFGSDNDKDKGSPSIPLADQALFRKMGLTRGFSLKEIRDSLFSLSGDNLLKGINVLLSNRMSDVDKLSKPVKDLVYEFIPVGMKGLTDRQRNEILPILPILSIRHGDPDGDEEDLRSKQDNVLYDLFIYYVHQANKKPLAVMNEVLNSLNIKKLPLGARLRRVLSNSVDVDEEELDVLSLQELYDLVDDLDDSPEHQRIRDYFAMEFIESFYLTTLPIVLLISEHKEKLKVPGVNAPLSVKELITFFEEYVELNDAN